MNKNKRNIISITILSLFLSFGLFTRNEEINTVFALDSHECSKTSSTITNVLPTSGYINGEYYLDSDLTLTNDLIVVMETSATICLNGYVLDLNGFKINNGGTLTITDCQVNASHRHYYEINDSTHLAELSPGNTETEYSVQGGVITNGWIKSDNGYSSTLTLDDINILGCSNNEGALLINGVATIDKCRIRGNKNTSTEANKSGTVLILSTNCTDIDISNCDFDSNYSECFGGAINVGSSADISNCIFSNNTAVSNGGAIYVSNKANISNCDFDNNTSDYNGGAIFFSASSNVYDCSFSNNEGTNGGAIYSNYSILVEGCSFDGNTATGKGGAIYLNQAFSSFVTLIDTTIENNTAVTSGGGIYSSEAAFCLAEGTKITMSDGTYKNIEDIVVGDSVKAFNHETGELTNSEVYFVYESENTAYYFTLNFSNNTSLDVVGMHDLLNEESLKYLTISEENANSFIGKHFYNASTNTFEELESVTYSTEKTRYYSIYTDDTYNCVSNDMLTVPDDVDHMVNLFDFDNSLKIDQVKKQQDIDTYGLFPFELCTHITYEEYIKLQAKYLYIILGKNLATLDEIFVSIDEYRGESEEEPVPAPLMLMGAFFGSPINEYDTYTSDFSGKGFIVGSDVTIKNNEVSGNVDNVGLFEGSYIFVIEDSTNIDIGFNIIDNEMSCVKIPGDFAKEVYSDSILSSFTSDVSYYHKLATKNGEGDTDPYTYSIALISQQPSESNKLELKVYDEALEDVTYQWYKCYEFDDEDTSALTSHTDYYDMTSGTIVDSSTISSGAQNNITFRATAASVTITFECSSALIDDQSLLVQNGTEYTLTLNNQTVVITENDSNPFTISNFNISGSIDESITGKTSNKLGTITVENLSYYCKVTINDYEVNSNMITPKEISFDANSGVGTVPSTVYQFEGYVVTLPSGDSLSYVEKTFLGWNTTSESTTALEEYKAGSADQILYAIWKDYETLTSINFNELPVSYVGDSSSNVFYGTVNVADTAHFTVKYIGKNVDDANAENSKAALVLTAKTGYKFGSDVSVNIKNNSIGSYVGSNVTISAGGATMNAYKTTYGYEDTNSKELVVLYKITKAIPEIDESMQEYDYTGTAHGFVIKDTSLSGFNVLYKYGDVWKADVPTQGGYYDVKVTRDAADGYSAYFNDSLILVINGAILTSADIKICDNVFVYNGDDQINKLTAQFKTINGTWKDLVIDNIRSDNSMFETEFKDASNYSIDFVLPQEEEYNYIFEKEGCQYNYWLAEFEMKKATTVINVDTSNIVVNHGTPVVLPEATSNFGTPTCDKTSDDLVDIGEYTVTYMVYESTNYEGASESIIVKVLAKQVKEPVVSGTYTYDGSLINVVIDGFDSSIMTQSGDLEATNAGTYTITYSLNSGYEWKDNEDGIVTWTIEKAQAHISIDNKDIVYIYGDEINMPVVSSNIGTINCDTQKESIIGLGIHYINYFIDETPNYYGDSLRAIITIKKGKAIIDLDYEEITVTYGETVTLPEASSNLGTVECDTEVSSLVNAGTYTVTYSVKDHEFYDGSVKTVTVTIKQIEVQEPTVTGLFVYDGLEHTPTITGYDSSIMSINGSITKTDPGLYQVEFILNPNYKWYDGQDGIATFEIKPLEIKSSLQNKDGKPVTIVKTENGFNSTITVEVVVTDKKDISEAIKNGKLVIDYNTLINPLYEIVASVYDVKLYATIDGVKTEIQPSYLGEGTNIKVKLLLPSTAKLVKIIHVHNALDIDYYEFDSAKLEDGYYVIETTKLSEFAFVYTKISSTLILIICLSVFLLLLIFIVVMFIVWKKEYDKAKEINTLENRKLKGLDGIYKPINNLLFNKKENIKAK